MFFDDLAELGQRAGLDDMAEVSRACGRKIDGLLGHDLRGECRRVSIDFEGRRLLLTF